MPDAQYAHISTLPWDRSKISSTRTINCLSRYGYSTVASVIGLFGRGEISLRDYGRISYDETRRVFAEAGIELPDPSVDTKPEKFKRRWPLEFKDKS